MQKVLHTRVNTDDPGTSVTTDYTKEDVKVAKNGGTNFNTALSFAANTHDEALFVLSAFSMYKVFERAGC